MEELKFDERVIRYPFCWMLEIILGDYRAGKTYLPPGLGSVLQEAKKIIETHEKEKNNGRAS